MSEPSSNKDLASIFIASQINRLLKSHENDIKEHKFELGIQSFLKALTALSQKYNTNFKPKVFSDTITSKESVILLIKERFSDLINVNNDTLVINVEPASYEKIITNIVTKSTLNYSALMIKGINEASERIKSSEIDDLEPKSKRAKYYDDNSEARSESIQKVSTKDIAETEKSDSLAEDEVLDSEEAFNELKDSEGNMDIVEQEPKESSEDDSKHTKETETNTEVEENEKVPETEQDDIQDVEKEGEISVEKEDTSNIEKEDETSADKVAEAGVEKETVANEAKETETDLENDEANVENESETNVVKEEETNIEKESEANVDKEDEIEVDKEEETNVDEVSTKSNEKEKETEVFPVKDELDREDKKEETENSENEDRNEESSKEKSKIKDEAKPKEQGAIEKIRIEENRKRSNSPAQQKRFQHIAVNLIDSIQSHRFSSPFLLAVNKKEAPEYYDVIYQPRDLKNILKAIKQKTDTPMYSSIKELERDVMLMFANCIMYNQSSEGLVELTRSMMDDVINIFKLFEETESEIK